MASRVRLAGLGSAAVLAAAAVLVLLAGLVRTAGFGGVGADLQFARWALRPLLLGAVACFLLTAVAVATWVRAGRVQERSRWNAGGAVALVAAAATLVAGGVGWAGRRHPTAAELRAARSLTLPAGVHQDRLTSGSIPFDSQLAAGPPGDGPPVVVRTWGPATCAALDQALAGWVDHASLVRPTGQQLAPGVSCLRFATRSHFAVRASMVAGRAVVLVAPPGVGL